MDNTSFEVEGLESLLNKLNNMGKKGINIQNEALQEAAKPILNDAVKNAPELSGKLKRGLKISKVINKNGEKYVLVGTDKKDKESPFYGFMIEFGTSKMPARPFLRPAYEANKKEVIEKIKQEIVKGLNKT